MLYSIKEKKIPEKRKNILYQRRYLKSSEVSLVKSEMVGTIMNFEIQPYYKT